MKERRFAPCNLGKNTICLGKQGEANHLRIEFDCSGWLAEFQNGVVVLYHFPAGKKSADKPYLKTVGTDRVWTVSAEDTVYAGDGVIELVMEDAETGAVLKSATGYTNVIYSPSAAQPVIDDGDGGNDNEGGAGTPGEDGGYYKPSVSSSGVLSWTPSKTGMPSVNTVNIRGPEGKQGQPGYTPQKGIDYFDGAPGVPGKNGQAATLEIVDADSLPYGSKPTVTEEEGSTQQARKYRLGIPEGKPGPSGTGIDDTNSSTNTTYSSSKIDELLNEQKEAIDAKVSTDQLNTAVNNALTEAKNSGEFDGAPGAKGDPGEDGHTPEKGVDYWTAADKQGIVTDVLAALPNASGVNF